jgi:hypothetical protein
MQPLSHLVSPEVYKSLNFLPLTMKNPLQSIIANTQSVKQTKKIHTRLILMISSVDFSFCSNAGKRTFRPKEGPPG